MTSFSNGLPDNHDEDSNTHSGAYRPCCPCCSCTRFGGRKVPSLFGAVTLGWGSASSVLGLCPGHGSVRTAGFLEAQRGWVDWNGVMIVLAPWAGSSASWPRAHAFFQPGGSSLLGAMSAEIVYEYPVLRQELSWTGVDVDSGDSCFVFYFDIGKPWRSARIASWG